MRGEGQQTHEPRNEELGAGPKSRKGNGLDHEDRTGMHTDHSKHADIDWAKVEQHAGWLKSVTDLPDGFSATARAIIAHTGTVKELNDALYQSGLRKAAYSGWQNVALALAWYFRLDRRFATEKIAAALLCDLKCNNYVNHSCKSEAAKRKLIEYMINHSPSSQTADDIFDPADPMRSARKFMAATFLKDGFRTLHRHRSAFWSWTGSHYRLMDEEMIKAEIWTFLETKMQAVKDGPAVSFKPTRARVGDVLEALGALCQLDKGIDPPAWLTPSKTAPLATELFACGNGLLHLPTGKLYPPSPDFFNLAASNVVYDPNAPNPVQWLAFLDQLFKPQMPEEVSVLIDEQQVDEQSIGLLQEWFGYSLPTDTSQQKILLIVGPKRSGKGTSMRILRMLLGPGSVAGPTISSLSETFGLEPLITKTMAIISDARIGAQTNKTTIVERLLSISGEDPLTIARKHRDAWHGELRTRISILSNELPALNDGSGALAGRFLVILLIASFFDKEDPTLTSKLATELPGILNWAIEGYRALRERGHFIQPAAAKEAINDIETLAAPVKAFIRDRCEVGPRQEHQGR